ncbi:MAG: T9SS type A sorting domain-containing protein [Cyclobacteriaceae bacterium]|jgi:hypothetical protein|nr:T9SS type A sorting domain-containing protein [Cyclobacteriaceae bacterium]
MKKLLIPCFFCLISALPLAAQRRVIVPEGFGTLNEIIRKDTIAGGQRKDPNTVYVLRRGGVYVLSGTIISSGFSLLIEAEEGSGPRPYVVMGFLEGGSQVEECFDVRGNATFRSIHLTAVNELNTFIARVVSVSTNNARLSFYDCLVDGSGQTFIRVNNPGCKVYLLNSTVSRMGRPSNPDNGRVIDERGNQMDSVVIENTTMYNITSRIIRDGGSEINYVRMNQNTFVNVGQRLAAVGPVNRFIFTNNLVVNPRFLGNTATSVIVSLEFSPFGASPFINLNHNNYYYQAEILNAWQQIRDAGSSRVEPAFVSQANQPLLNQATGIIRQPVPFSNAPVPPFVFVLASELNNSSTIPDWDWTGPAAGNPWEVTEIAYHGFAYPTSEPSYTGSSKGEPLGDLRWFPQFDVAWTVTDLAGQAEQLIAREANNPVIGGDGAALTALQNAIANALTVANNGSSTGAQLANERNALKTAMDNFRASLIITEATPESSIVVFPNPAHDYLHIEVAQTPARADLINIEGRSVLSEVAQSDAMMMDVRGVSRGLYLLRIQTKTGTLTKKILIR